MLRRVIALGGSLALLATAPAIANQQTWTPTAAPSLATADIKPERFRAFTLDASTLRSTLSAAPERGLKSRSAVQRSQAVIALPAPDGELQRFRIEEAPVMEPGLAARHPELTTYTGVGIDDPTASVHADSGPLGFHASVRSGRGDDWRVDPYSRQNTGTYLSYYRVDAPGEAFSEPDYEAPPADVPEPGVSAGAKSAAAAARSAQAGPEVMLHTYRLAVANDSALAAVAGGAENVLAQKVTLVSRLNQFFESELKTRFVLIDETEQLNLSTDAMTVGANGPCGSAPCFTPAQVSRCSADTLDRNQIVLGQLVGAQAYDMGLMLLGNGTGGVTIHGGIGGANKGKSCAGSPRVLMAINVEFVAHELAHALYIYHTFNGSEGSCGNYGQRHAWSANEPGSGTSIMSYAGNCGRENVQRMEDPYFSYMSYRWANELFRDLTPAAVNEVHNVALRDFGGVDSFTLGGAGPITRGVNYTAADIQGTLQGSEVQTFKLGDASTYTLSYQGAQSMPIERGRNDTTFGIQNALQGGNERQQATITNMRSFRIRVGGLTTAPLAHGGRTLGSAAITAAINALPGYTGVASTTLVSSNATGITFAVTFGGSKARTNQPPLEIVDCGDCTATVREQADGGAAVAGWPTGGTVVVNSLSDAGFGVIFGGTLLKADVPLLGVSSGTVAETTKVAAGPLPTGATVTVAPFGGTGAFTDEGFQVTYTGTQANRAIQPLALSVTGGSGFVGVTTRGGPDQRKGTMVPTGNHAPVPNATTEAEHYIPVRTPISLTDSFTDDDGDPMTYLWENYDFGDPDPTPIFSNTKVLGPLSMIFPAPSTATNENPEERPRTGWNHPGRNPTREYPDLAQVLSGNTNAETGRCPEAPPAPEVVPQSVIECFADFMPTSDYKGYYYEPANDLRTIWYTITARDGRAGGGGTANWWTATHPVPTAGPFLVTSHSVPQTAYAGSAQTVRWEVAGTDRAPISVTDVKISLSTDGGRTYPHVLAASTPNDGAAEVRLPEVTAQQARIKVEAIGNVFFDLNNADFAIASAPTGTVGGTVPATLALTLGPAATFAPFVPGVARDYTATTTADVISTAGDAALSYGDPGRMTNGAFSLAEPLRVELSKATWTGPVSNERVGITFKQLVKATDPLRTGSYSKAVTFSLSTTTP